VTKILTTEEIQIGQRLEVTSQTKSYPVYVDFDNIIDLKKGMSKYRDNEYFVVVDTIEPLDPKLARRILTPEYAKAKVNKQPYPIWYGTNPMILELSDEKTFYCAGREKAYRYWKGVYVDPPFSLEQYFKLYANSELLKEFKEKQARAKRKKV